MGVNSLLISRAPRLGHDLLALTIETFYKYYN
jgi:hypothetical protein